MIVSEMVARRERSIDRRLNGLIGQDFSQPMFSADKIQYELSDRTRAVSYGGIGLVHQLVGEIDLAEAIDRRLHLLKIHLPYHESDHVLNIAYNWTFAKSVCSGAYSLTNRRKFAFFAPKLGVQTPINLKFAKVQLHCVVRGSMSRGYRTASQ